MTLAVEPIVIEGALQDMAGAGKIIWRFGGIANIFLLGGDSAMVYTTPIDCRAPAKVFKALGHPTRLFIALELGKGRRCVCELQELVGADMSTISKHLSVLREAGLVTDERRGTKVFYSLTVPCVLSFMSCVEGLAALRVGATGGGRITSPEVTK